MVDMNAVANWIKLVTNRFNSILKDRPSGLVTNENNLIVVVLGATAAGKSKLAIDIASRFNGEIISADSIQMYKGLDIVTNKVTLEERNLVKHHLMDFVDPLKRLTVVDFRYRALRIIDELLSEKKLPVIVGGTNYYIESLLWDVLVDPSVEDETFLFDRDEKIRCSLNSSHPATDLELTKDNILDHAIFPGSFKTISSFHLHNILRDLDPEASNLYHPNDKRKIIRALQVIQSSSTLYSSKLKEQRKKDGANLLGGPLRFKNSVILWTSCDMEILKSRIDERVESMMKEGLLDELIEFHRMYNERRLSENYNAEHSEGKKYEAEYSEGIFQAIGLKDFHEYLIKSEERRRSMLLNKCVAKLKMSTRKYARKQIKWIENRFICATDRDVPPIYSLDTSDPRKWDENVRFPAFEILSHRLRNLNPPTHIRPVERKQRATENVKQSMFCDICQRYFQGSHQFQTHLKSKLHAKVKRSRSQIDNPVDKTSR